MVRIKSGVTPRNLVILAAAANVSQELGEDLTITSGTDGKHMVGSKHYNGDALDIRLIGQSTPKLINGLRKHLGLSYQVILETDHVHVEYDPK